MPVDPVLKQDLMLVKQHFEEKAVKQSGDAVWVPVAGMIRAQSDTHKVIRNNATEYPSYYAKNIDKNKSTLDRIQEECIPCASRIKSIFDCDLAPQLNDTLLVYNQNVLNQVKALFKNLNGQNPVEQNLCSIYRAYKSQCVPDIKRMVAALAYLLADIRSVDFKRLKENFIQVVLSLVAGLVVNISFNYDRFAQLITDTLKCVVDDVRTQLAKISPILPQESRFEDPPETIRVTDPETGSTRTVPNPNTEPVEIKRGLEKTKQVLTEAWNSNNEDKQWSNQGGSLFNPLPPKDVPFNKQLTDFENAAEQQINKINKLAYIIEGQIEEAIERIDRKVLVSQQELLKLLKANSEDLKKMNDLIEQVLIIQGLLNVLQGLLSSATGGDSYDPCGDEENARRFFSNLTLPNTEVILEPVGTPENPDNVEVTFVKQPITVSNPIIQDILQDAGLGDFTLNSLDSGDLEVQAEPVTINIFKCLGKI